MPVPLSAAATARARSAATPSASPLLNPHRCDGSGRAQCVASATADSRSPRRAATSISPAVPRPLLAWDDSEQCSENFIDPTAVRHRVRRRGIREEGRLRRRIGAGWPTPPGPAGLADSLGTVNVSWGRRPAGVNPGTHPVRVPVPGSQRDRPWWLAPIRVVPSLKNRPSGPQRIGDLGGVAGPARAAAGRGLGQVEDACASWGVTVAPVFDRDAVVADPGDRAVPVLREAELDLGGPVLGLPGTGLPAAMFPEGLAM